MVMQYRPSNVSATPPNLHPITQEKFNRGVISVVKPANLPLNALVKADNMLLKEDGRPIVRPGSDWYGTALPTVRGAITNQLTNLCTNPNFNTAATTNWAAGTNTTLGTSLTGGTDSYYMTVQANAATFANATAHFVLSGLTIGQTYQVYASVRAVNTAGQVLTLSDASSTAGANRNSTSVTTADTSTWYPLSLSFTPSVSSPVIRFQTGSIASTGPIFGIDKVAIGVGLTAFFDGNTTDSGSDEYDWTGTADLSTSTKTTYLYSSNLDGGFVHTTATEEPHMLAVSGGNIFRSLNNAQTWAQCSGALTDGYKTFSLQIDNLSFLYNKYDHILRYNGTPTLLSYTALPQPVAPTAAKTGAAGTTIATLTYTISAVNDVGYTQASTIPYTSFSNVVSVDRDRSNFDASNFVTLTWNKGMFDVMGDGDIDDDDFTLLAAHFGDGTYHFPVRYDLYLSINGGPSLYIDSIDVTGLAELANIVYIDKGQSPQFSGVIAPTQNTTLGPRVGDMALVGTRIAATDDLDFPWRVWFSGDGEDVGKFSNAYGATYIDLQKGSQFRPVKVEDYRSGGGSSLITVWRKGADGRGDIWQGTLDTLTVGTSSIIVPNFFKLPGSRGTNAPGSVVNVLNDYMYYNSQAMYNLGSRAQFLGLLSTDEATANIRDDVRAIDSAASDSIVSWFFEANVYTSVPYQASQNNRIIVFDTERKAWLPKAFSFGVERFFQYTDTSGTQHLMFWKPGDNRFSEISDRFQGDYGAAFDTELLTGHVYVNPKDRFEFMWCEEGEVEISNLNGTVTAELLAMTRESGFIVVDTKDIALPTAPIGWSKRKWTTHAWTAGSAAVITNYSEPTTKRYFNVQQDINFYQYRLTTSTLDSRYIPRTLQVQGTNTEGGKPREWELL